MALRPLQAGREPLGQFDGLDADLTSFKGGEACTFVASALSAADKAAKDASDGYVVIATPVRPVVALLSADTARPVMLADEGVTGYGTLFGSVVGGTVGQVVTGGASLGPHTATGSGKVTCWDKPGTYAITLDAVDTDATNGLVPTNTALTVGSAVHAVYTGANKGKLTSVNGTSHSTAAVGRSIELATDGVLVTTPGSLVTCINSPVGVSTLAVDPLKVAIIHFNPPLT